MLARWVMAMPYLLKAHLRKVTPRALQQEQEVVWREYGWPKEAHLRKACQHLVSLASF